MNAKQKTYIRFNLAQRIEHIVLVLSFTILGVTGLPQKYALSEISQWVIKLFGGIESIRIVHRVAATVFLLEAVYHVVVIGYKLWVRREAASMVPTITDGKNIVESLKYNLGMDDKEPKMPRYNFAEKMEYWAMLWGLFVMAVTGFMLWNPIATTNILPGDFIPAAKVAHGGEAVLAVLAIIIWHFWSVHLKFFNLSMWTGKMTRAQMHEEHALELEALEAGKVYSPPPATVVKKRQTIYLPIAAVASIVMLALVYWFVSFEKTAITTVPPAEVAAVFVPPTPTPVPPSPTPEPTQPPQPTVELLSPSWSTGVGDLLQKKCVACHGTSGDFSAETYADAMKAVVPGTPADSKMVQVQSRGKHPGQFTPSELDLIKQWISAGAPEQPVAVGGPVAAGGDTWATLQDTFKKKCGACHGTSGNFTATTYADVMKAITAGDPDASKVVEAQKTGTHPGKFTAEELQKVIDWIKAGAPEK